jgi:hypothetical protein
MSFSADEDEELQRAIALSLETQNAESDDDVDLRQAIALSLQAVDDTPSMPFTTSSDESGSHYKDDHTEINPSVQQNVVTTGTKCGPLKDNSIPTIIQKRKASSSPSAIRYTKELKTMGEHLPTITPSSKYLPSGNTTKPSNNGGELQLLDARDGILYPEGVVKKTWVYGYNDSSAVKLEDVLQKDDLNIAVFSAFDWDLDFLLRKLDLSLTKLILVMGVKGKAEQERWSREAADMGLPCLKVVFPDMSGPVNIMHSKLMLLFHKDHLRIAIPTANMTKHDWGESGLLENVSKCFLIGDSELQTDCID